MKFWENHAKEMRKARLLQAAAVVYTKTPVSNVSPIMTRTRAVEEVLALEELIEEKLSLEGTYGTPESNTRS